jgi:hypothetical protein
VINSSTTRHIYANKKLFSTYTPFKDGEKVVYLRNSRTVNVLGKGKVFLKLTTGKALALNEVLYVPNIREKLIYMALLEEFMIKVSFGSNKIVMIKNNVYLWGKDIVTMNLFVLNVANVMNENTYSSTYFLDFIHL